MDQFKNLIDSKLNNYETKINEGHSFSKKEAQSLHTDVLALYDFADLSLEEKQVIENRIANIESYAKADEKFINNVSNKSLNISPEVLSKIKLRVAIATVATIAVAGVGVICIGGCGHNKSNDTLPEIETETTTEEETKEIPLAMSDEMQAFSDITVESINNTLEVGINLGLNDELTETDKETYAKVLSQYRIVANMDDLTKLQYAELFGELDNPTEDLLESFFEYNTMIKKHLLTVSETNKLDYNNLYNSKKDAEVLNESENLIAKFNEAKTNDEKLDAAKNWYNYVVDILTSTEGNIALSSQALDTLITHSEAFDELTRGKYSNIQGAHIDDELEHYFNVAKDKCLGVKQDTDLDVEDLNIENLKSLFRTSIMSKLQSKYQDALIERELQLTLGNILNPYNSFDNVVSYIEGKIDLTKYKKIEIDYIEKQYQEKGIKAPAEKSKDDSGISNGQSGSNAGNISKSDMIGHGVDPSSPNAKQEYEQAVINEANKTSEASTRVENSNGEVLDGTVADNQKGFQDGYALGNSGKPYVAPSGNKSYNEGYNNGYNAGKRDYDNLMNSIDNDQTQTFIPEENGEVIITETESYQDYTGTPSIEEETDSDIEYETIFVPIDGDNNLNAINQLYALRDSLINENRALVAEIDSKYPKRI